MTKRLLATSYTVLMLATFAWADEPDAAEEGQEKDRATIRQDDPERVQQNRGPELRPPEVSRPMLRQREQSRLGVRPANKPAEPDLREHEAHLDELRQRLDQLRRQPGSREQRERAERAIGENAERTIEFTEQLRGPRRPGNEPMRHPSPEHPQDARHDPDRDHMRGQEQNRGPREVANRSEMEFRERIERKIQEMFEQSQHEREQRDRVEEHDRERMNTAERIDHLHQAAEHLRHAGQGELAEQVMERVGDMEKSLHHHERENADRIRERQSLELRELHARMDELQRAVHELTEQVQHLRRERE